MSAEPLPVPTDAKAEVEVKAADAGPGPESRRRSRAFLALVPPPVRARRAPFVALVLVILAAGLVGLLLLNTASAQDSFRLHALQSQAASLSAEDDALANATDGLDDPARLAARAAQLGLVPGGAPIFLLPGQPLPKGAIRVGNLAYVPAPIPVTPPTPVVVRSAATPPVTKPVATKPKVTKPTVTKPTVTKPGVTKPAVKTPVAAKSATKLPVTGAKPVTPAAKPVAKPAAKPTVAAKAPVRTVHATPTPPSGTTPVQPGQQKTGGG
jgi:hypothetical protein